MINTTYSSYDPNLPPIVTDFLNYLLSIKGKSKNTVDAYKADLSAFLKFIKSYKNDRGSREENIDISDINIEFIESIKLSDIYAYMNYITIARNNGPHARARKTSSIKSFFKYLHENAKAISKNTAEALETPKISREEAIALTLNESIELLNSVDGMYRERDFCILTLFLNCGLRLSELTNINMEDINEDTLRIPGKGNRHRVIYLNSACMDALRNYMRIRDKKGNSNALFLSERGKRISNRSVQYIVKKYLDKAQLNGGSYSVQNLRHTAAALMYKYGNVDIRSLKQILGHENISTTKKYAQDDGDKLRKAMNSNPLSSKKNDN